MKLFDKIREISLRRALERKAFTEMAMMSDAEMKDLDLSYSKIADPARQHTLTD